MKIYLVGGAVRDQLLGKTPTDRDYVVVGQTPDQMIAKGFKQVGKDFPVFLHPETREEYALARKERKIGPGHTGFTYDFSTSISIEEDLFRRDFTVNAMAQDLERGQIIDPFGGQEDLQKKKLRHVSDHFREDPLRVLRLGRFLSQLPDFHPDESTLQLAKEIAQTDELNALSGERVWLETSKALMTKNPHEYFELLKNCNALKKVFPELEDLIGVPQNKKYHREGDAWIHTMLVIRWSAQLEFNLGVRFACLVHDLGKGITPKNILPSHKMHEINGLPLVESICKRLSVSKKIRDLALKVTEFHLLAHKAFDLRPKTLLKLILQVDAFRRPEVMEDFLNACICDNAGKESISPSSKVAPPSYDNKNFLLKLIQECSTLDFKSMAEQYSNEELPDKIYLKRLECIKKVKQEWETSI